MKFKLIFALLLVAVFVSAGAVFAQEAPKAEEPKPLVEVSGVLFLDYGYYHERRARGHSKKGDGKEGADAMRLTRAYVTFAKKIDDVWSMKATLDGAGLATINEYSAKDERQQRLFTGRGSYKKLQGQQRHLRSKTPTWK